MNVATPGEIDPALFRETLGHYPTGVAAVTGVDAAGAPVGMVVGTFSSISLDPPLVSFSPQKSSRTFALLRECDSFCVNVLAADQEELCRVLATGGEAKFDAVPWAAAPSGAPVLDGVVAWVDCSWEQIVEAGDHYIVLGRVRDVAVPRTVAPLLFFQGGYGRFTSPSLMAAASPDLLEAVRLAESIRAVVEERSRLSGLTCSVTAQIASEVVTVLVAGDTAAMSSIAVGQRMPHIAPIGSVFVSGLDDDERVEAWMGHLRRSDEATVARLRENLAAVREHGYSIALRSPASDERRAAMAEYSSPDSLPCHARRIRELIAASVHDYEPTLRVGERYDLYSVAVPVATRGNGPALALRLSGLPQDVDAATVETWVSGLLESARQAERTLA